MNKKILSGIIVGVTVLVGGYFVLKSNKGDENTQVKKDEVAVQPSGKKMAFSEFVKQGGSYKCDVKQSMSDMQNDGTVYISGSNMRGEYTTIAEGRTMQTSFIMRDGYSYTWSTAYPSMGFKVKVATNTGANADASAQGTYSWNANQIGDYNCEPWAADQSKFTIPTSITFTAIAGQQ